jgi:hypothetical protein
VETSECDFDALLAEAEARPVPTDALTDALASGEMSSTAVATELRIAIRASKLGCAYRAAMGVTHAAGAREPSRCAPPPICAREHSARAHVRCGRARRALP